MITYKPSRRHIILLLIVLAQISTIRLYSQIYRGYFEIPMLSTPPSVDGEVSSKEWDGAVHFSDFTVWTLDRYIPEKTDVWMAYDQEYIYVAFRGYFLDKKLFDKFTEPHKPIDSHMWDRTNFTIALSGPEHHIELKCGPTLSRMDLRNGDLAWNGEYEFKASVQEDHWMGEYKIPFSDLELDGPPLDELWSIKLKHSNPSGESSIYNGQVTFTGNKDLNLEFHTWPSPVPGTNGLRVHMRDHSNKSRKLTCEVHLLPFSGFPEYLNQSGQANNEGVSVNLASTPLITSSTIKLEENQELDQEIIYQLPEEGNYYAMLRCLDEDGRMIRQSQGYWFTITPNRGKINAAEKTLGECLSLIQKLPGSNQSPLQSKANDISAELEGLKASISIEWDGGNWDKISEKTTLIEKKIGRLLHMTKTASAGYLEPGNTFGIATVNSLEKLKRDQVLPLSIHHQISLSAAKNEYESFQLAILPFEGDLEKLTIEAGDLRGEGSKRISREHLEISLVDYNRISYQADYVSNEKGWHPDPLIPLEAPLNIGGDELCRPLWITLYVPENTQAGMYSGEIKVIDGNHEEHAIQLNLRVWDFALPVESSLKTHTWDELDNLADFYNLDEYPVDWYMEFCNVLLKNRMNPGFAGVNYLDKVPVNGKYDFSKVEKVLENAIPKGLNLFSMSFMKKGAYAQDELEKELDFIEAYADFLREKGWLDKAIVELWDEPTSVQWRSVKNRAEKVRAIAPDIRIQMFANAEPYNFWDPEISEKYGFTDLIDIWAPPIMVSAPELQAQGKEIWTYFCTLARSNAPNFFIDAPALYQRSIPWYCWMGGVDAFEHWSTTYIWRNTHKGKPMEEKWPSAPWDSRTFRDFHGEGQLVYPGPDGKIYPSLRLEVFREGMEDYEYLNMLKQLLSDIGPVDESITLIQRARELLKVEETLLIQYPGEIQLSLENTLRFPDQAEKMIQLREEIALTIEELQKFKSN